MSRNHDEVSGKIKAVLPFTIQGIADGDTPGGIRSKLMQGYRGQFGVAVTPKEPKMLVGRQCVVESSVRAGGSDGFCWNTVQQICGGVKALYPILWWHASLKQ
jgi:hypothetical protein